MKPLIRQCTIDLLDDVTSTAKHTRFNSILKGVYKIRHTALSTHQQVCPTLGPLFGNVIFMPVLLRNLCNQSFIDITIIRVFQLLKHDSQLFNNVVPTSETLLLSYVLSEHGLGLCGLQYIIFPSCHHRHLQPFPTHIDTPTQSQPGKATASSSGAVRVRRLGEGHLDISVRRRQGSN